MMVLARVWSWPGKKDDATVVINSYCCVHIHRILRSPRGSRLGNPVAVLACLTCSAENLLPLKHQRAASPSISIRFIGSTTLNTHTLFSLMTWLKKNLPFYATLKYYGRYSSKT